MTYKEWYEKYKELGIRARTEHIDINGEKLRIGDWVTNTPAYDLKEVYAGRISGLFRKNIIEMEGYKSAGFLWIKGIPLGPPEESRRRNLLNRLRKSAREMGVKTFMELDEMLEHHLCSLLSKEDMELMEKAPLESEEVVSLMP